MMLRNCAPSDKKHQLKRGRASQTRPPVSVLQDRGQQTHNLVANKQIETRKNTGSQASKYRNKQVKGEKGTGQGV